MPDDTPDAADLAASYGAMLNGPAWTEDVAPDAPPEPPPAASDGSASPPPIERIVEALLFVGRAPLTAERACEAVRGLTPAQLAQAIDTLNRDYRQQARPYRVQSRDHGYELTLLPRY